MDQLIGSLEVGKQADPVLVETDSINMFPIYVPYSALVYSANASNVDSVWIAGTCVLQNKQTVHDQKAIKDALVKAMATFKMRAIERSLEL